jgi:hypothetical protein
MKKRRTHQDSSTSDGFIRIQRRRMLHPLRMKQGDLKNPPCRKLSDLRQEKDSVLILNPSGFFDPE